MRTFASDSEGSGRTPAPKEAREVAATALFADVLGCGLVALKIDSQARGITQGATGKEGEDVGNSQTDP